MSGYEIAAIILAGSIGIALILFVLVGEFEYDSRPRQRGRGPVPPANDSKEGKQ